MELAFREPSKRITRTTKPHQGEALNSIINWKNTTNNAYDGEKLHVMYLDESGKWEKPTDIREAWRIERTCLIVGRKIIGKCLMGSTVNPMDKGGNNTKNSGETQTQTTETQTKNKDWALQTLYQPTKPSKDSLTSMETYYRKPR